MIKAIVRATVNGVLFAVAIASAQTDPDLEHRVTELERKIRLLEPAFAQNANPDLARRVADLEAKINELLAARQERLPQPAPEPAPEAPALQPLASGSVSRPE